MKQAGRIALLAALLTMLFAGSAHGQSADLERAAEDPYWFGPYFAGLEASPSETFGNTWVNYGECTVVGEGACSRPASVRTSTTCSTNPLSSSSSPSRVFLVRGGGLALQYDELQQVEIGTGDRTVTVETREPELLSAALREVRRRSQAAPAEMVPPVYPPAVLGELKRVTAAAATLHGVKAIAKETELSPDEVRMRMKLAELLGPDALAGVPVPELSTARVRRLTEIAVNANNYPARTAEKNGITVAQLRKLIRPVRGLAGYC